MKAGMMIGIGAKDDRVRENMVRKVGPELFFESS